MNERLTPGSGVSESTVGHFTRHFRETYKVSAPLRLTAITDWVAIQRAQAEEKRALLLDDQRGAEAARERISELDARMSLMGNDPKDGDDYVTYCQKFERAVFRYFLQDARQAIPTRRGFLTIAERRIWAAQRVQEMLPKQAMR